MSPYQIFWVSSESSNTNVTCTFNSHDLHSCIVEDVLCIEKKALWLAWLDLRARILIACAGRRYLWVLVIRLRVCRGRRYAPLKVPGKAVLLYLAGAKLGPAEWDAPRDGLGAIKLCIWTDIQNLISTGLLPRGHACPKCEELHSTGSVAVDCISHRQLLSEHTSWQVCTHA